MEKISLAAIVTALLAATDARAANWQLAGGDAAFAVYYDASSIGNESFPKGEHALKRAPASYLIVWTRWYWRATGELFSTAELAFDCRGNIGFLQERITGNNPEHLDSYDQRPRFEAEGVEANDTTNDPLRTMIEKAVCALRRTAR